MIKTQFIKSTLQDNPVLFVELMRNIYSNFRYYSNGDIK